LRFFHETGVSRPICQKRPKRFPNLSGVDSRFLAVQLSCNYNVEILEGGAVPAPSLAVSPPECLSRHSSNKLKPALTEQRFDKARNKARDKDCSTKSYTLHCHGYHEPRLSCNFNVWEGRRPRRPWASGTMPLPALMVVTACIVLANQGPKLV
jgi:hypothetical protein